MHESGIKTWASHLFRSGVTYRLLAAGTALLLVLAGVPTQTQSRGATASKAPNLSAAQAGPRKDLTLTPVPAGLSKSASEELRSYAGALLSAGPQTRAARVRGGASGYYIFRVEFDNAANRERLRVPGATVLTAYDRFADLFIPARPDGKDADEKVATAIINSPGFRFYDFAEEIELPPPGPLAPGAPTRAVPEEIVRGGVAGLTGKGVIVAVIDSGIDFRNPDFIAYDAAGQPTSRLLYFWDSFSSLADTRGMGGKAPYSFPNGQSIGTLYTREQLTAELRSGARRIPATDENGHGTAAAGVATGNGNNSKGGGRQYIGVAPEAEIIGVRLGGSSSAVENEYLLNAAVAWIDQVAKRLGKPVVISCSFGGQRGGHDGNTVEERELDARFPPNLTGRAIVIAAGNEQQDGLHSRLQFRGQNEPARFLWEAEQTIYVSFFIRNQSGRINPKTIINYTALELDLNGVKAPAPPRKLDVFVNPLTNELVATFQAEPGWSGISLDNSTGEVMQADGYILGRGSFHPQIQRAAEIVGTPGTAAAAITVGSYDWNDNFSYQGKLLYLNACGDNSPMQIGALSCYSSLGFSRAPGVIKPDISSPGQWFSAPYAKLPDGSGVNPKHSNVDTNGNYMLFNGTSAATPYTAGIVALMFQKRPALTLGDVKSLLHRYATQDSYTGTTPNLAWGYGKLDLEAVRSILGAL